MELRRGFAIESGERTLVVEDVVTTGGSTRETIDVAKAAGAEVLGAAAIIDRGGDPSRLSLPLYALAQLAVPSYQADSCPMCAQGVPITKPGSRAS